MSINSWQESKDGRTLSKLICKKKNVGARQLTGSLVIRNIGLFSFFSYEVSNFNSISLFINML